ncbi:MAG: polysaccharide deacetylase family protein [Nocardioidaceae bacterium]
MQIPAHAAAGDTAVSLVFNDGRISQYTLAAPALKSHTMNGTFYVSSNFVASGDSNYMAGYQVDSVYQDGNEIGGMTRDHIDLTQTYNSDPTQDTAYKKDQVCGDKQWLAARGYDPVSFAYPFAASNSAAESIVQSCGYTSARTTGGLSATSAPFAESIPPADPFHVSTAGLNGHPITLQSLEDAVTAASSNGGGWLPIAFDRFCQQGTADYNTCMQSGDAIDVAVFSSFLDWLQSGAPAGVSVKTVRDVMGGGSGPTLPPRPTKVSLTFDDGDVSQNQVGQALASHNMHGTFYINSKAVDDGEAGAMTWSQIHALASAGNDIGGHTLEHTDLTDPNTTYDFKWHSVCTDRARLVAQGFNPQSFAYPFAAYNSQAEGIVAGCGYQSARTGGSLGPSGPHYAETIPPKDAMGVWALGTTFDGPISLQSLEDAVTAADTHGGGWVPMIFHTICYPGASDFNSCMAGYRPVDFSVLTSFMDWLATQANQGVTVADMAEVMGAAPQVKITSPTDGGNGGNTPTVSGTGAAGGGDVTVNIYSGSYSTGTPTATMTATNNSGSWTATAGSALPDGTYTLQATQSNGGVTGASTPVTFQTSADTAAPAPVVTKPANGSSVNVAAPDISGTAGNAPGDAATVGVKIYTGTTATGTAQQTLTANVGTDGSWTVTPGNLTAGTYTVQATQTDSSGNTGTSPAVTFSVDLTAPRPTITAPVNNSTVNTVTFPVAGTAGTAAGDAATVTLDVFAGTTASGTPVSSTSVPVTAGAWNTTTTVSAAGNYTLRATQKDAAGNTGTSALDHVKVASGMTATALSPNALPQGANAQAVTLTGSGFTNQTTVSFSGAGVSANVTSVDSPTSMKLAVTVAAGAATGRRNVVVSSPGQPSATCTNCLTVNAAPTVASATPALGQGAVNHTVRVNGTGFQAGVTAGISGDGVTSTFVSRTATVVTLSVSVAAGATPGNRDVTVTNPDGGNATCTGCFGVQAGPTITSVTPSTIRVGVGTVVTIKGSGFDANTTVTVSGTGITKGAVTVVDPSTLTIRLTPASTAPQTARDVTVANKVNFGSSTLTGGLTIGP